MRSLPGRQLFPCLPIVWRVSAEISSSSFTQRRFTATASEAFSPANCHAPPVVMCGPSGSGKSTLIRALMARQPWRFSLCVSHTTRKPRPGETEGVHYYFIAQQEMWDAIQRGDFLEYAEFAGHLYGTSKQALGECASRGRICLLDLDIQGVQQIKKRRDIFARYVFVKPPNMDVLERRLRGRGTESDASIRKRLLRAGPEIAFGETPGNFDGVVVNDDLETAVESLLLLVDEFCDAERRRSSGLSTTTTTSTTVEPVGVGLEVS